MASPIYIKLNFESFRRLVDLPCSPTLVDCLRERANLVSNNGVAANLGKWPVSSPRKSTACSKGGGLAEGARVEWSREIHQ